MKSPQQLSQLLAKQWHSADHREQRLLTNSEWPLKLAIGRPTASELLHHPKAVRDHLQVWRAEKTGTILWSHHTYKAASQAIDIPLYWQIDSPSQWLAACRDKQLTIEFELLGKIISHIDPLFHSLVIRQRSIWLNTAKQDIIQCTRLAMLLEAGIAEGRPLRALSIANIDSKFIEKNRSLLIKLLNIRFNDHLKNQSLEQFLNAVDDKDQWLLVIPLADNLLPYKQLRLRASELARTNLPGTHILVIENEQCRHQLPELNNTIAILGAGLNLNWLANSHFQQKHIAYWGDMDSWGLKMLAHARSLQMHLTPLLMTQKLFNHYQSYTVIEPKNAGEQTPEILTREEKKLYKTLLSCSKGRLEQEFIPADVVKEAILNWHSH